MRHAVRCIKAIRALRPHPSPQAGQQRVGRRQVVLEDHEARQVQFPRYLHLLRHLLRLETRRRCADPRMLKAIAPPAQYCVTL